MAIWVYIILAMLCLFEGYYIKKQEEFKRRLKEQLLLERIRLLLAYVLANGLDVEIRWKAWPKTNQVIQGRHALTVYDSLAGHEPYRGKIMGFDFDFRTGIRVYLSKDQWFDFDRVASIKVEGKEFNAAGLLEIKLFNFREYDQLLIKGLSSYEASNDEKTQGGHPRGPLSA